jgi:hypothetical protein
MPKPTEVVVRIADCDSFQRLANRLVEIADADGWASAEDVRQEVRDALETFASDESP